MMLPSSTNAGRGLLLVLGLLLAPLARPAGAQSFSEDLRAVFNSSEHPRPAASSERVASDETPVLGEETPSEESPSGSFHIERVSEAGTLVSGAVRLYQLTLSATDTHSCSFYPSCSHFGAASLNEYGVLKGGLLTADRLTRCHGVPTMALHYRFDPASGRYTDPVGAYSEERLSTSN